MYSYGVVSVEVRGVQNSPIVDRVVVSIICQPPHARFYSMDLRWDGKRSAWTGVHERVAEGRYSLVVDAAVDDLWLWQPHETEVDVVAGRTSRFDFSIQDKLRSHEKLFTHQMLVVTDRSQTTWGQSRRYASSAAER